MKYKAYWLHENGEVVPVTTIHIAEVIKTPDRFGYSRERVETSYTRFNEPMGHEGKARQEIMSDIIRNHGWIRIRFRPAKDLWIIELHTLSDDLKEQLLVFLKQPEVMGKHPNADINITELFCPSGEKHHLIQC